MDLSAPVIAPVGARTHWEVGGPPPAGATEVRAPAGIIEYEPADMTVTAAQRYPPRSRCTWRISGQVATTIIAAQMIAPRKGCRIQKQAAISAQVKNTART